MPEAGLTLSNPSELRILPTICSILRRYRRKMLSQGGVWALKSSTGDLAKDDAARLCVEREANGRRRHG